MNTTKPTKQPTTAALAARAVRAELKKAFPTVKFSVTSENFSMGNAVRIKWTDGPTEKQVDSAVGRFEAGSFDGMTDCYDYAPSDAATPHRAKYVSTSRNISPEVRARAQADLAARIALDPNDFGTSVHRVLHVSDLTSGYGEMVHMNEFPFYKVGK